MREPFDRTLKQITADAARRLLELSKVVDRHWVAALRPLEREIAGPAIRVDQLFELDDGSPWMVHFEFQARWESDVPWRIGRYQSVIRLERSKAEVRSVVFVLRPEGCPPAGVRVFRDGAHSPIIEASFHVVRVWELDPAEILADPGTALLPLAVLMKVDSNQVVEIARRVRAANNPELEAQFVALASVRYDTDWIAAILGDPMFTKEVLKHSWAVQEVANEARAEGKMEGRAEGEVKGRAEGEVKGRVAEAHAILRRFLAERFPGLEFTPERTPFPSRLLSRTCCSTRSCAWTIASKPSKLSAARRSDQALPGSTSAFPLPI